MTCKHADHLLCRTCLAERWGRTPQTISNLRAQGKLPEPTMNADLRAGWMWHQDRIESYERGEAVPMWWPANRRPGLQVVAS